MNTTIVFNDICRLTIMPIRIKSIDINDDVDKFTKLFHYMKKQGIVYDVVIITEEVKE